MAKKVKPPVGTITKRGPGATSGGSANPGWHTLKIGGGGFQPGGDISADGSVVVHRSDEYGAYAFDGGVNRQLVTVSSLTTSRADYEDAAFGVAEIRIAPSVPTTFYMIFQGDVWRSTNSGGTWIAAGLNFAAANEITANSNSKGLTYKLAVDPANADVAYLGTYSTGVWFTTNGTSWTQISSGSIPFCTVDVPSNPTTYPGHPGICFGTDVSGGRTQTIYVPVYGLGLYRITNAGSTPVYTDISSGGPGHIYQGRLGADGIYYAVKNAQCAVAVTAASPSVVTWTGHSFTAGQTFQFLNFGTLPTGVSVNTTYYVLATGLTTNTFRFSLSNGGAAINGSGSAGSGNYCSSEAGSQLFKYASGSWTNISPGTNLVAGVAPDPSNSARVVAVSDGGKCVLSGNRGSTWGSWLDPVRVSADIPWLAWTKEDYFSCDGISMDTTGKLHFWQGLGYWQSDDFVGGASPSSLTVTSKCQGIENLTVNRIATASGTSKVYLSCWDRSCFVISDPETYPSTHAPDNLVAIRHGWDVDIAVSDPTFAAFVGGIFFDVNEFAFYTTNSGTSWTVIPYPSNSDSGWVPTPAVPLKSGSSALKAGGCIAISTPLNFIVVPSNSSLPWVTADGGSTWTEVILAGMPTSGITGYGASYLGPARMVAADKVNIGTFYLYNFRFTADGYSPSYTGTQSIWRSTDGGVNWTKRNTLDLDLNSVGGKLIAVPTKAGHLFLSGGTEGGTNPGRQKLLFSSDAGATWTVLSNVLEPWSVCAGKAAPGNDYPTIYFSGYYNGVMGVWRSTNSSSTWTSSPGSVTWTQIGPYPLNWALGAMDLAANLDTYGTLYAAVGTVGAGNAGYMYYVV